MTVDYMTVADTMLDPIDEQLTTLAIACYFCFIAYCRLCHVYYCAFMSLAKQKYVGLLVFGAPS